MAGPQNFLDNLKNLEVVVSVALEHVQGNRDQFAKSATGVQLRQAEKAIGTIRALTVKLDKEFTILEYLLAGSGRAIPTTTHAHRVKSAPIHFHRET